MKTRPTTSAKLTRRSALAALVGLCGYGGYRWWEKRNLVRSRLENAEAQRELTKPFEQVVTLEFGKNVTIAAWLAEFHRQTGIKVEMAPKESGLLTWDYDNAHEMNFDWPPMTARLALDTLSELYEVDWLLRGDGVVVLNGDRKDEPRQADVHALPSDLCLTEEQWAELIALHFEQSPEDAKGSRGSIEYSRGALTIVQTVRAHEQIKLFCTNLSSALRRAQSAPLRSLAADDPAWEPSIILDDPLDWEALHAALIRPLDLPAAELPLAGFVAMLAERARFPILVHPRMARSHPNQLKWVTQAVHGLPLHDALHAALGDDSLRLVPMARGKILVLTTKAYTDEQHFKTLLAWPVSDLVRTSDPDAAVYELSQLLNTWPADVRGNLSVGQGAQVIFTKDDLATQAKVRDYLRALRQVHYAEQRTVWVEPPPIRSAPAEVVEAKLKARMEQHYIDTPVRQAIEDCCFHGGVFLPQFERNGHETLDRIWCNLPAASLQENLALLFAACGQNPQFLHRIIDQDAPPAQRSDSSAQLTTAVFDLRPRLVDEGSELRNQREITSAFGES